MSQAVTFEGFDELDDILRRIPNRMATELQGTLARQMIAAKRAVVERSNMSAPAKRALRARDGIVQVEPKRRVQPRNLEAVRAAIYSTWQGAGIPTKAEAIGVAIEKEVGKDVYRPTRARRLLIPAGDFALDKRGRGQRARRETNVADLPDTRVVRLGRSRNYVLIQELKAGERGRLESTKGVRKNKLGVRERIVGVLVPRARITTELDFFGAWASLASRRTRDYGRLLDRVIRAT